MEENIFDLQTDINNLIIKHGLEDGEYAFIYKDKKLVIVDLSQQPIKEAVEKKNKENLQNEEEVI